MSEATFLVLRNAGVFLIVTAAIYGLCLWMIRIEDDRARRRR
ncbi:MAG TPA: hypothetical protein VHG28_06150 [Longimicrobiaceae bacterium]|nr:hypothetical protein [Longimicrobiaceae bacterium]